MAQKSFFFRNVSETFEFVIELIPTDNFDPENKKVINCDEKLKKIFGGKDSIGFLEFDGLISPHFL
ncbi:pentatricopeptide repeat-containing protein [Hibiscus syriacus]|uniref:Pentatricopeptide repeat-containing protein n=1 Tax=Hibiscus syriacus TaxID=106335 RepID=A0A6A3AVQ7_HIBSY|nr:pentatricopeptide repeat-containing protein [Hibiscus syriacus]